MPENPAIYCWLGRRGTIVFAETGGTPGAAARLRFIKLRLRESSHTTI
jgi:hypothetical protein